MVMNPMGRIRKESHEFNKSLRPRIPSSETAPANTSTLPGRGLNKDAVDVMPRFLKNGAHASLAKISIPPKNPWTLQWKGLNLYSRGRVLKIAIFEGSGFLGPIPYHGTYICTYMHG